MSILLRSRMYYDCDTEAERSLSWNSEFSIYTRDSGKWWVILDGAFVERQSLPYPLLANEDINGLVPLTGEPVGNVLRDDMSWGLVDSSEVINFNKSVDKRIEFQQMLITKLIYTLLQNGIEINDKQLLKLI